VWLGYCYYISNPTVEVQEIEQERKRVSFSVTVYGSNSEFCLITFYMDVPSALTLFNSMAVQLLLSIHLLTELGS